MRARALVLALAFVACRGPVPVVAPAKTVEGAPAKKAAPSQVDVAKVVDDKLDIVARMPAYFAESAHGRVFVLAPDRTAVTALDLATGDTAWRTVLDGDLPTKMVPAFGPRKRLLLHGGSDLFAIDAESGALVKKSDGGWSNGYFEERNGACSMENQCSLRFVDCDDAHPYGPVLSIAITHLYAKIGAPHDNVCWGPLVVVGRANNVVVAVTDGRTWGQTEHAILVAFDASTGKNVWSTPLAAARVPSEGSGIDRDGSLGWVTDDDGHLVGFDVATGHLRPLIKLTTAEARPKVFTAWAGGLFVSEKHATLLDGKTGKARWSIDLPADGLALPLGVKLDLPKFSSWGAHTVLLVDPKTGKEVARFSQPEYTEIVQAEDLGLGLVKGPSFDAQGKPREAKVDTFTLDREHLPRALLAKGTKVLEVATDLAIAGQSADHVAVFVWGRKGEPGSLLTAKLR